MKTHLTGKIWGITRSEVLGLVELYVKWRVPSSFSVKHAAEIWLFKIIVAPLTCIYGIYFRVDEITAGKKEKNGKKEGCFHFGRRVSYWKCSSKHSEFVYSRPVEWLSCAGNSETVVRDGALSRSKAKIRRPSYDHCFWMKTILKTGTMN